MKKYLLVLLSLLFIPACSRLLNENNSKNTKPEIPIPYTKPSKTTSDYDVFTFDKFDLKKVDTIYYKINHNQAYRVQIVYNKNKQLADEILRKIQYKINYFVGVKNDNNIQDNIVIVTVYRLNK